WRRAGKLVERANRSPTMRAAVSEGLEPMTGRERRSFLVEQRALIDETPSIESRLPRLYVPTAIVQGTSDHIVPAHAARSLAALIPGAELILCHGAGHLLPFDQEETVAGVVRRYAELASR
ncbi:MAG: alpha/beta fold hydrolase, partial [Acidimicrobiales bacterium]